MSGGGRRRRGSGGHPAKVAQRRERGESRRVESMTSARLARQLAGTAAGIQSPLEAELWASHLLGMFWANRYEMSFAEGVGADPALLYGEELLPYLARGDAPGAALAVAAIAELEDGELGEQAKELLDRLNLWRRLPPWAGEIGESEIVGAAVMRDPVFDDGRTVFLESRYANGDQIAVGVLIDNNLGGMAMDVLLAESIDQVTTAMQQPATEGEADLVVDQLAPGVAAGLIHQAITVTDMTWDPPVLEDYWPGRALARLRADQTPGAVTPAERDELPQAERDALRDAFLASDEGSGFAPDGDEAWVAALAIDFCADYVDGDPLRWSPVVVELFMADWVPRKVMTSEAMLQVLPGALEAWVRFAARRRGLPDWALALTVEAIAQYAADMRQRAADPEFGGPSKSLLLAAQQAGVDFQDAEALDTFIAGWNARSGLDSDAGASPPVMSGAEGPDLTGAILEVKISLTRVAKPPVWRRLQVLAETPLDVVHQIIQAAFGWEDSHLHVFEVAGTQYGPVDPELELDFTDERRFTLADLVTGSGDRVTYTYDFGDDWRHEILPEKLLEPVAGVSYPVLVTAKGACPPEDCGGVWGYQNLKDVLADPEDEEHEQMLEWLGLEDAGDFDPKAVDVELIRRRLVAIRLPR